MPAKKPKPCPTPWKKEHPNKAEAQKHCNSLYRKEGKAAQVHPYECSCGKWHVGGARKHRKPRRRR